MKGGLYGEASAPWGGSPMGVASHNGYEPVYGQKVDGNHQVTVEYRRMDIDERRCGERHDNWPGSSAHPALGRAGHALDWLLEVANLRVKCIEVYTLALEGGHWLCTNKRSR